MSLPRTPARRNRSVEFQLRCLKCRVQASPYGFTATCPECGGSLDYEYKGRFEGPDLDDNTLWRNFELLPVQDRDSVVSIGEGASKVIEVPECADLLNGAGLFLMMDATRNPTGTFKDREASVILTRCKEAGLDNLVFYSTGNTGRSYVHYAATLGLTTYLFVPEDCYYKQTASIQRNRNNYLILVREQFPHISAYVKKFATMHRLNAVGTWHDRIAAYTTIAYEQFQCLPECTIYAQTIASGMGPIGFVRGHQKLIDLGLEPRARMPRIVCVQSSETNGSFRAYSAGKQRMTEADMHPTIGASDRLFEPTLNSTNPVHNYPALYSAMQEANGAMVDATPEETRKYSRPLVAALENRGIRLRYDLEKSLLIGFTGLVKLAEARTFQKSDRILLLATGRGGNAPDELLTVDASIDPFNDDPADLMRQLTDEHMR